MTFTLHNPLTEEEWDIIEDVDFEHTNSITFHTKHGKEVEFVKRKTGHWIDAVIQTDNGSSPVQICDQCNTFFPLAYTGGGHRFCPNCGAKMEGVENDKT